MIAPASRRQLAAAKGHLLYLGLSPEARLCSRGRVEANGQLWEPAGFTTESESGPHGIAAITIVLDDIDFHWSWRLREEFRPGLSCEWWEIHGGAGRWECEPLFSGVIDAAHIKTRNQVQLVARVVTGDTAWAPRVPFESPYSLARGSEIVINGTTYRVE